jgi:hypothetical protein
MRSEDIENDLADLRRERADVDAELQDCYGAYSEALSSRSKQAQLDAEADAYLAGIPLHETANLREQIDTRLRRRQVLDRAIAKVEARLRLVRSAEMTAAAEELLPEYKGLIREIVTVAAKLGELLKEEEDYPYRGSGPLRPMPLGNLRHELDHRDPNSALRIWVNEAVAYGLLKKSEIPHAN